MMRVNTFNLGSGTNLEWRKTRWIWKKKLSIKLTTRNQMEESIKNKEGWYKTTWLLVTQTSLNWKPPIKMTMIPIMRPKQKEEKTKIGRETMISSKWITKKMNFQIINLVYTANFSKQLTTREISNLSEQTVMFVQSIDYPKFLRV